MTTDTLGRRHRRALLGLLAAGPLAATWPAGFARAAEAYPIKSIRFVMPFPPGGGSDLVARVIAEYLGKRLGQPVVVDNVGGAAGLIGTQAVIHAPADGYTLLITPQSPITIAGSLEPKPNFDVDKELLPLAMVASTPSVLVVNSGLKANTLAELAALTRAEPDKYFYGSPGEAHEYQLTAALLLKSTGGRMTHVAYRGVAPAVADVVANQVQMTVAPIQAVRGFIADGRLRALAIVGGERLTELPSVPTTVEAGVKDVTVFGWFGVFAPNRIPKDVSARLSAELLALPADTAYAKKMADLGFTPLAMPSAEFTKTILEHRRQWKTVIQTSSAATAPKP
jgi:tripartite-type tricarboxylate transporter receptor subunit TctC